MPDKVRALISRSKELHRAFRAQADLWSYGCMTTYLFKEDTTIVVEVNNHIPTLPDGAISYCKRCFKDA